MDRRSRQSGDIFLTGGLGFLGRALLEEIVHEQSFESAFVLVMDADMPPGNAIKRLRVLLEIIANRHQWMFGEEEQKFFIGGDKKAVRIIPVQGDITLENLGIAGNYDFSRVTHVCHAAAVTDLIAPEEVYESVNLRGTLNMLNFARRNFERLQMFGYVGTAYDLYDGREVFVPAGQPPEPKQFVNGYSRSKWFARKAVAQSGLPYCIFLPGIICGRSTDGYLPDDVPLGVIYGPPQGMVLLKSVCAPFHSLGEVLEVEFYSIGDESATLNVIPLDTVAILLNRILTSDQNEPGSVYYLTHPYPVRVGEILRVASEVVGVRGIRLVRDLSGRSSLEKLFARMLVAYQQFMLGKVGIYDRANTQKLTGDIPMPAVDEDFLRRSFCFVQEKLNWGYNQPGSIYKESNVQLIQKRFAEELCRLFTR